MYVFCNTYWRNSVVVKNLVTKYFWNDVCASGVRHWRITSVIYNGDIPALKQAEICIFLEARGKIYKTSQLKYGKISGD